MNHYESSSGRARGIISGITFILAPLLHILLLMSLMQSYFSLGDNIWLIAFYVFSSISSALKFLAYLPISICLLARNAREEDIKALTEGLSLLIVCTLMLILTSFCISCIISCPLSSNYSSNNKLKETIDILSIVIIFFADLGYLTLGLGLYPTKRPYN